MNCREKIEKIWDIVKNCEFKSDDGASYRLFNIKKELEKYIIKYSYYDKYGVEIKEDYINNENNIKLDEKYASIRILRIIGTKESGSYILNSDKQPNDELLMSYSHPTGAYMFESFSGNYYDKELFLMYFNELKKYNYKYIDEMNHDIYFDLDEGFKLYKEYPKICKKYQIMFDRRKKKNEADKLREKLSELEKEIS